MPFISIFLFSIFQFSLSASCLTLALVPLQYKSSLFVVFHVLHRIHAPLSRNFSGSDPAGSFVHSQAHPDGVQQMIVDRACLAPR